MVHSGKTRAHKKLQFSLLCPGKEILIKGQWPVLTTDRTILLSRN